MKDNIFISLFVCFLISIIAYCEAQNLFRNPGFEDTTLGCPAPGFSFNKVPFWEAIKGSPDYNNCGAKHAGYTTYDPHSGSGYAGALLSWSTAGNYHEAFMQELVEPLIKCAWYEFSVYAKHQNANNLYRINVYGSKEQPVNGACSGHFKDCSEFVLLGETEKVSGTWAKYSFKFQATDTFKYISIIGSYLPPANAVRFLTFDDFSLTLDTSATDTTTIHIDTIICIGDSINFEASPIGCGNYFWYVESDPDTIISTDSFLSIAPQNTTTYIFNTGLKENSYTVIVNPFVYDSIINDTSICSGFSIQLFCDQTMGGAEWEPSTYLNDPAIHNPISNPTEEISYAINIISYCAETTYYYDIHFLDPEGCPKENTVIALPSIFTPNGDGLNDEFTFVNNKGVTSLQYLRIINRYGQVIFETNNVNEGWDGKKNGIPQLIGSYYYQVKGIHITDGDFNIKGIFELIK